MSSLKRKKIASETKRLRSSYRGRKPCQSFAGYDAHIRRKQQPLVHQGLAVMQRQSANGRHIPSLAGKTNMALGAYESSYATSLDDVFVPTTPVDAGLETKAQRLHTLVKRRDGYFRQSIMADSAMGVMLSLFLAELAAIPVSEANLALTNILEGSEARRVIESPYPCGAGHRCRGKIGAMDSRVNAPRVCSDAKLHQRLPGHLMKFRGPACRHRLSVLRTHAEAWKFRRSPARWPNLFTGMIFIFWMPCAVGTGLSSHM